MKNVHHSALNGSLQHAAFSFARWREIFLKKIMFGAVFIGFVGAVFASFDVIAHGNGTQRIILPLVYAGAWLVLIALMLLRRPYWLRAGVFMFLFYALGVSSLLETGMRGNACLLFLTFVILAAMFFSPRTAMGGALLSFLTILVMAGLLMSGRISLMSQMVTVGSLDLWVVSTISFLLTAIIVIIGLSEFLKEFESAQLRIAQVLGNLDQERTLLRTVIDHLPAAIFVKDVGGRKTLSNRADLNLAGSQSSTGYLDQTDIEVMNTGQPLLDQEEWVIDTCQQERWLLTSKIPLQGKDGKLTGLVGISHDITERKRVLEELRQGEERFSLAMETTNDGLFDWNPCTNIDYYSPGCYRMLGYQPDEFSMTVQFWNERIHPDDFPSLQSLTNDCLDNRAQHLEVEFRIRAKNGDWKWVLNRARVINRDANGKALRIIGSFMDVTERATQLKRLAALREIDRVITSSQDLRGMMKVVIQQTMNELHTDAASVYKLNPDLLGLECLAKDGFEVFANTKDYLPVRGSLIGRAVQEKSMIFIPDLAAAGGPPELIQEGFVSYYAVPMIAKQQVMGVLEVFFRKPCNADQEWLNFLETLAGQAAIAVEHISLFQEMQRSNLELKLAYDSTIEGWSSALDLRDKETEDHSKRVTDLTLALAVEFKIRGAELKYIRWGALLHDIGKLGVPDRILLKDGDLSAEEWTTMRKHPVLAYNLLSRIDYLRPSLDIPHFHHEKWDGSGYPLGLKGNQIPLPARLFAVVDVFDALTSERPYRKAWSKEKALDLIREQSGKHFDPKVVAALLNLMGAYTRDCQVSI